MLGLNIPKKYHVMSCSERRRCSIPIILFFFTFEHLLLLLLDSSWGAFYDTR